MPVPTVRLAQPLAEAMQRAREAGGAGMLANLMGVAAIYPINIAKAIVDTMIFALLLLFARSLVEPFRAEYAPMPDLGLMIGLGVVTAVVGMAYYSFLPVAYPLLFPDSEAIYGWVFLVLILLPLAGLAVVVARNLDALTALVMRSGSHSGAPLAGSAPVPTVTCSKCNRAFSTGGKFCPHCGAAAEAPSVVATNTVCASCGADNPVGAKFCKACGQPV